MNNTVISAQRGAPAPMPEQIGEAAVFKTDAPQAKAKLGDITGAVTAQGVAKASSNRPTLPAPVLSPAAMMIALTSLSNKMLSEQIQVGENTLDTQRSDLQTKGRERLETLRKHFEKLDQGQQGKRTGLFGFIANFFKALFTFDFKALGELCTWENLGNVLKDIATLVVAAVLIAAAAAATAVSGGAGSVLLGLAIAGTVMVVAGMVASDPGVIDMIAEALPEDSRNTFALAMSITGMLVGIIGSIMTSVATGGLGATTLVTKLVTAGSQIGSAAISAGMGVNDGIKGTARADAQVFMADVDRKGADMENIKTELTRSNADMRALYDAYANIMQSMRDMVLQYGQNQNRAASV